MSWEGCPGTVLPCRPSSSYGHFARHEARKDRRRHRNLICPLLPLAGRYRLLNLYNHFIVGWFARVCGVRYTVRGRDNVPAGPVVILANHQCEWETLFLQILKPPVCTVLKQELLNLPLFGWALPHLIA